ncbi:hypothetical protein ACFQX7_11170 [Luedemannella flava]
MITKELPERGDSLRLDRTGEPLEVGERVGEGAQGVVHRAVLGSGTSLALKWYRRTTDSPAQRSAIKDLTSRPCPHPTFLWPIDTVTSPTIGGFGYVMPWMDKRFTTFAQVVNDPQPLGLQTKARIGRKLAEAFGALHAAGLCYRDINFGNLWVDPLRGDIAILDNDNVGIDDGHVAVWGVLRFMAPEVIRREKKPSTTTDLHSLAVLLFYLLMHGHPLDGRRVENGFTWDGQRRSTRSWRWSTTARRRCSPSTPTTTRTAPWPATGRNAGGRSTRGSCSGSSSRRSRAGSATPRWAAGCCPPRGGTRSWRCRTCARSARTARPRSCSTRPSRSAAAGTATGSCRRCPACGCAAGAAPCSWCPTRWSATRTWGSTATSTRPPRSSRCTRGCRAGSCCATSRRRRGSPSRPARRPGWSSPARRSPSGRARSTSAA